MCVFRHRRGESGRHGVSLLPVNALDLHHIHQIRNVRCMLQTTYGQSAARSSLASTLPLCPSSSPRHGTKYMGFSTLKTRSANDETRNHLVVPQKTAPTTPVAITARDQNKNNVLKQKKVNAIHANRLVQLSRLLLLHNPAPLSSIIVRDQVWSVTV